MPRLPLLVGAVALIAGVATHAARPDAASSVQFRHEKFKQVGRTAKSLRDALRGSVPNMVAVRTNTHELVLLAAQLPGWFPPGSGPDRGTKTHAKAAIWNDPQAFSRAAMAFSAAAKATDAAASHGAGPELASAGARLAGTCKSCHQQFRDGD